MDTELKDKWVEALRSGRYKQGIGALRSHSDKYCCLGVLCDAIAPEGWTHDAPASRYEYHHENDWDDAVLPPAFRKSAPVAMSLDVECQLVEMNDGGRTFEEIADWIKENL